MSTLRFHRETKALACDLGIEAVEVIPRGRHSMLVGRYRGKPLTAIISNSPSGMALKNVRADLRRRVREIANQDAP